MRRTPRGSEIRKEKKRKEAQRISEGCREGQLREEKEKEKKRRREHNREQERTREDIEIEEMEMER